MTDPAPQTTPTRDEAVLLTEAECKAIEAIGVEIVAARPMRDQFAMVTLDTLAKLASAPAPASGGVDAVRLRQELGGVSCEAFRGDNLAIFIVSEFNEWADEDEEESEGAGWKLSALAKTDQVLDAIHAHYAPFLSARRGEAYDPTTQPYDEPFRHAASPSPAATPHEGWLERAADRALALGRRPTRTELFMCQSEWEAATPVSEAGGLKLDISKDWLERKAKGEGATDPTTGATKVCPECDGKGEVLGKHTFGKGWEMATCPRCLGQGSTKHAELMALLDAKPASSPAGGDVDLIRNLVIPMVRERSREPGDAWHQAEHVLASLSQSTSDGRVGE